MIRPTAGCRTLLPSGMMPLALALMLAPLAAEAPAQQTDTAAEPSQVFSVRETSGGRAFDYRMTPLAKKPAYRIYRLSYPSPVTTPVEANNTIPADYYLPEGIRPGDPKRPAVICLHILEGNFELVHLTCSVLASREIPAVMFKLPYYGQRSPPGGRDALSRRPDLLVEALSQGLQDVRRTIDVLSSRPEVDPQRIGITGISMGGILAASAAGSDARLHRAALILAGGDLRQIIHHARETRDLSRLICDLSPADRAALERAIDAVDPLSTAPRLRDRARDGRVLMINAAEDEVIPRPCTEKLAAALGIGDRVIWLEGLGHYTAMAALPEALRTTADFFARDLPPGVEPAATDTERPDPLTAVVTLIRQVGLLLVSQPKPGRCHFVDLSASVTFRDGETIDGSLRLIRGHRHRFCIDCRVPKYATAALGQGDSPWMASGERVVFSGKLPPDAEPRDPLCFADPKQVLKLRMASGILAALALAPDMLENWVTIEQESSTDAATVLRITDKRNRSNRLRLVLGGDGTVPRDLTFDVDGIRGRITFRIWHFDAGAHDSIFEPPGGVTRQEVDADDLYRMFSAAFNFAMENVQ